MLYLIEEQDRGLTPRQRLSRVGLHLNDHRSFYVIRMDHPGLGMDERPWLWIGIEIHARMDQYCSSPQELPQRPHA